MTTELTELETKLLKALKELVCIVNIHQNCTKYKFAWAEMELAEEVISDIEKDCIGRRTPGQWGVYHYNLYPEKIESIGPLEASFMEVDDQLIPFLEVREEDARIMSVAPRMLEALKAVIKSINRDEALDLTLHETVFMEVLNTIRQAEGKPEINTAKTINKAEVQT